LADAWHYSFVVSSISFASAVEAVVQRATALSIGSLGGHEAMGLADVLGGSSSVRQRHQALSAAEVSGSCLGGNSFCRQRHRRMPVLMMAGCLGSSGFIVGGISLSLAVSAGVYSADILMRQRKLYAIGCSSRRLGGTCLFDRGEQRSGWQQLLLFIRQLSCGNSVGVRSIGISLFSGFIRQISSCQ
jgi:hypothetical protein